MKTHCLRGHEFTQANTYASPGKPTEKICRACKKDRIAYPTLDRATVSVERFYENVTIGGMDECWIWRGSLDKDGYGRLKIGSDRDASNPKRTVKAHRFSYTLNVGPIPEGLTLDHVKARGCRFRACVNPSHLEPVTAAVNTMRGDAPPAIHARRSACARGHEYAQGVRYRFCPTCRSAWANQRRQEARS